MDFEIKKQNNQRLTELTYLNVVFTLMVIVIHILGEPVSRLDKNYVGYFGVFSVWKLFQFVTQGFIFLSGIKLFLKPKEIYKLKSFYLGRAKRVYLPYAVWTIITYAYLIYIGWYAFNIKELGMYIAHGNISSQFYFVILICQFYLLTPLINKSINKNGGIVLMMISLFASLILGEYLPWIVAIFKPDYYFAFNDRLFTTYLFYFVAGCVVGRNYSVFKEKIKKSTVTISAMFVILAFANLSLSYMASIGKIYFSWGYILHFAYSVFAILLFFCAAMYFAEKKQNCPKLITKLDYSSYMLYLSHILVLLIFQNELTKHGITNNFYRLLLVSVLMGIYVFVSVFVWEYLKKHFSRKAKCI